MEPSQSLRGLAGVRARGRLVRAFDAADLGAEAEPERDRPTALPLPLPLRWPEPFPLLFFLPLVAEADSER